MNIQFHWIGYQKDKILGFAKRDLSGDNELMNHHQPQILKFWGTINRNLVIDINNTIEYRLNKLISLKNKNGYDEISYNTLMRIWPDFDDLFLQNFVLRQLSKC